MSTVGFVGLGEMGTPMARRLIEAGHTVRVWNRTSRAADELVSEGAVRVDDVKDAVAAGTVFSMLASDSAVAAVFTDDVLRAAPAGAVHVNHATVSVEGAKSFAAGHAAAGLGYVAAPVLGRSNVAELGKLNIVVAGARDHLDRVQPFLDIVGKRTWVVGTAAETASLVKIGVNYNLIHTLQALAESITLVEKGGVDGQTFVDILTDSAYTGSAYTGYGSIIARRRYSPPGFTLPLGLKDLSLAEQAADAEGVALPTAPVLREMFEEALSDSSLAGLDWAAIAEVTRRMVAAAR